MAFSENLTKNKNKSNDEEDNDDVHAFNIMFSLYCFMRRNKK
jgi:hypothetical protein